jgi:uncharacterized protein DUF4833
MTFVPMIFTGIQIASALTIAKSSNKNEVHYAVELTGACTPSGTSPVHAYWQMREKSADATETLSAMEERAYGLARQEVTGDTVRIVLRALPDRPISIRTFRGADGACASEATTTIQGASARIGGIFVKMKLFGVAYVQLSGVLPSGGAVSEKLSV